MGKSWQQMRPDHWVPLAVVSGVKNDEMMERLYQRVVSNGAARATKKLGDYYPKLDIKEWKRWTPSDHARDKVGTLCEALNLEQEESLTIHWERMDYR